MPEKLVACPEGGASEVESESQFRHTDEGRSERQPARLRTLPPKKAVGIHTLNPLEDSRWDDLVARHPRASAFHQRGWLQALARTYGYEPVVLTTSSPIAELKNGL
ncbi:MAG: hypothetical protein WA735_16235, partial [Candidatus Acidiferrales bacterium]